MTDALVEKVASQHAELIERLRAASDLPDISRVDPLLVKVITSLASLMSEAATALAAVVEERDALAAEVAKLRTPEWFYNADDGEYTYGDVSDTVDDMGHDGVMRVGGAREVWKKWVAVRCVALDADGDVDETEVMTFDSEDEALRCWPESLAIARAALVQEEGKP